MELNLQLKCILLDVRIHIKILNIDILENRCHDYKS